MDDVFAHIAAQRDEAVADLQTLLHQPSISGLGVGLEPCAEMLWAPMIRKGIADTRLLPTDGRPPVVVGRPPHPAATKTLLRYAAAIMEAYAEEPAA